MFKGFRGIRNILVGTAVTGKIVFICYEGKIQNRIVQYYDIHNVSGVQGNQKYLSWYGRAGKITFIATSICAGKIQYLHFLYLISRVKVQPLKRD